MNSIDWQRIKDARLHLLQIEIDKVSDGIFNIDSRINDLTWLKEDLSHEYEQLLKEFTQVEQETYEEATR